MTVKAVAGLVLIGGSDVTRKRELGPASSVARSMSPTLMDFLLFLRRGLVLLTLSTADGITTRPCRPPGARGSSSRAFCTGS